MGVQGQLIAVLGGITLVTLLLVWVLINYFLQPQYNRTIRSNLESRLQSITARIDAADAPLISRDLWHVIPNTEFFQDLTEAIENGELNIDNCCIDISDHTYRSIAYIESLYPCILHESMAA